MTDNQEQQRRSRLQTMWARLGRQARRTITLEQVQAAVQQVTTTQQKPGRTVKFEQIRDAVQETARRHQGTFVSVQAANGAVLVKQVPAPPPVRVIQTGLDAKELKPVSRRKVRKMIQALSESKG